MAHKNKQSTKRKRIVSKIPGKRAFKESSSLPAMSPSELQEWTGDSTPSYKGFENLPTWPPHDWSKPELAPDGSSATSEDDYKPAGRSWADLLHELFVAGQIGILFVVVLVGCFILIMFQDNAAGKWDDMASLWISLRKVGIGALVLAVLYAVVKLLARGRK